MKKILVSIMLAAVLLVTACNSSSGAAPADTSAAGTTTVTTVTEATTTTSATTTANELSEKDFVIKPHILFSKTMGDTVCFLQIRNDSSETVGLSFNVLAHDADDGVLGASDGSLSILGPGEESVAFVVFSGINGVDHVSYTMKTNVLTNRVSIISKLGVEPHINKSNIVLTVTNNSEKVATNLESIILMFDKDDNLVDFTGGTVVESYEELAPGAAVSKQYDTYSKFEYIKVFFHDYSY